MHMDVIMVLKKLHMTCFDTGKSSQITNMMFAETLLTWPSLAPIWDIIIDKLCDADEKTTLKAGCLHGRTNILLRTCAKNSKNTLYLSN